MGTLDILDVLAKLFYQLFKLLALSNFTLCVSQTLIISSNCILEGEGAIAPGKKFMMHVGRMAPCQQDRVCEKEMKGAGRN